ncbi:hypothetical protein BBJ28_00001361 [Nothophytophthora sp. Chile5]|nr:hypothetical protein BBJ28_00001361 [Nothophytophthora sp. Chile5]
MGIVSKLFTYAKLVVAFLSELVLKLLRLDSTPFAERTRSLLGTTGVALPDGDKRLLVSEPDAGEKKETPENAWVAASDEEMWEPGGRELLTALLKANGELQRSTHPPPESNASQPEDALVELSDGEDATMPIFLLGARKPRAGSMRDDASALNQSIVVGAMSL